MEQQKKRRGQGFAIGIAMGIPLGIPIGLAMGNLAIGPAIGLAIGVGLGALMENSYRKREAMENGELPDKARLGRWIIGGFLALAVVILVVLYIIAKTSPNS